VSVHKNFIPIHSVSILIALLVPMNRFVHEDENAIFYADIMSFFIFLIMVLSNSNSTLGKYTLGLNFSINYYKKSVS